MFDSIAERSAEKVGVADSWTQSPTIFLRLNCCVFLAAQNARIRQIPHNSPLSYSRFALEGACCKRGCVLDAVLSRIEPAAVKE